jgi:LAO/AO transport system kinase
MTDINAIIKGVSEGNKIYIAKAITIIENDLDGKRQLLKEIYPKTGNAYRIGITGPPGAGKSTLTNALVKLMTEKGLKVGVVAIDPTSPFTGGALLGDRIRMNESAMLKDVFIRSMATRGSLGGLSKSTSDVCDLLDASGKDYIIVETVGVGQTELDIAETADTTVVTLVPESGDSVQTLKAGLMEIADVFVVNKSDRQGADSIAMSLKNIIHLKPASEDKWDIRVINTTASQNKGVDSLYEEIVRHREHLIKSGYLEIKRRHHLQNKIMELVNESLKISFWNESKRKELDENLSAIILKQKDPYSFVDEISSRDNNQNN